MSRAASESSWISVPAGWGAPMHDLVRRLYPVCRSITGNGVRETLRAIGELIPLNVHEVPTGTPAFDWTVPKEWNIRDAYIAHASGERLVDFRTSNLHVVGYSAPIRVRMALRDLQPHLHSLPDQPALIPYRTSYYHETWGFCLSHDQRSALTDGEYDVVIDSTLADGSLSYGECVLPGATDDEVLIYTHTCHPSLANDNLAGIAVCTFLARLLEPAKHRYTYRFVFGPGTIGSLVWLSRNQDRLARIRHGLVAVLLGDPGPIGYKRSRQGGLAIDHAVEHVLKQSGRVHTIESFSPYGYDERQFGSPGFNLPVGRLSRSANDGYAEYHTSADNPDLVRAESLFESLSVCADVVATLEHDLRYINQCPYGEPQLGRRGLYRTSGGEALPERERAMLWVLNQSDGEHSLLDIAERACLDMRTVSRAAADLAAAGLLVPVP